MKYRRLKSSEKEIIDSKIKSNNKVARLLFHLLVILGVMWKHYVTSPFQNYAEFSVSTTRRTLQQRHASKAISHPAIHTFYLGPP